MNDNTRRALTSLVALVRRGLLIGVLLVLVACTPGGGTDDGGTDGGDGATPAASPSGGDGGDGGADDY